MAGTDNILAGLEGLLGGISSVATPILTHRANAAYDAELERKKREQELQQQISFLPIQRENTLALKRGELGMEQPYKLEQIQASNQPTTLLGRTGNEMGTYPGKVEFLPAATTPKETEEEKLSARYAAKKKQLFPKAKLAINNLNQSLDKEIENIDAILKDPDLGKVTGPAASRVPTATKGQARVRAGIDQLKAQAFLSSFTALKNASPNGSAGTGALSENEGTKLEKAAVNLDTKQGTKDFSKALGKYREELVKSKQNFQTGFQDEFGDMIGNSGHGGTDQYTPEQLKKLQELQGQ